MYVCPFIIIQVVTQGNSHLRQAIQLKLRPLTTPLQGNLQPEGTEEVKHHPPVDQPHPLNR